MRIGIFGGSFNPPHTGHLIVAESVREQLQFDRILFIPSAQTPNKQISTLAGAAARLEMTRLAVAGNSCFDVSDIEVHRKGISFTIDTINELSGRYPDAALSLIIGTDNLEEFSTWKSPDEILAKADLVVMNRPAYDAHATDHRYARLARRVNVPSIGISGTDIRRRVKLGRSIRYLVPLQVEEYILHRRLYRE